MIFCHGGREQCRGIGCTMASPISIAKENGGANAGQTGSWMAEGRQCLISRMIRDEEEKAERQQGVAALRQHRIPRRGDQCHEQ
jgi:hypothetical protein